MKKQGLIFIYILTVTSLLAQPKIKSFSPLSGKTGSTVTIKGTGFNKTISNNIVFFGAAKATVTGINDTSLTVTVPSGTTYENISVTDLTTGLTDYSSKPFNVTFCGDSEMSNFSFSDKHDFKTGDMLNSVKMADFDGDGKSDIITVGYNSVIIYKNQSIIDSVILTKALSFSMYSSSFVAICDFNGDGKLDFAVLCDMTNIVSIYKNTSTIGTISFQKVNDYNTGKYPTCIATGDLNQDGKPEMVISCPNSDSISIYKNTSTNGNISFATRTNIRSGNEPIYVAINDFNGDLLPDIAVADNTLSATNTLSILKNISTNNTITFASITYFGAGPYAANIGIADFNGDGKSDLAISNYQSDNVMVNSNCSNSSSLFFYTNAYNFEVATAPANITVNDFNGDGKPDFAVVSRNNFSLSVLQNTSYYDSANYDLKTVFNPYFKLETSYSPYGITSGDLNGDGKPEIVSANEDSTLSVFYNVGTGVMILVSTSSDSIIAGTSVDISAELEDGSTDIAFNWSTGETSSIISVSPLNTTTYTVTGTNLNGCQGIGELTIKVAPTKPITPTIQQLTGILHSSSLIGNQWYDSNGEIQGATNQDYKPTQNGTYYVIVTIKGISSEKSNTINIANIGTSAIEIDGCNISLYPVPVKDKLFIKTTNDCKIENLQIHSESGKVVYVNSKPSLPITEIALGNLPAGTYFIQLTIDGKNYSGTIIKE